MGTQMHIPATQQLQQAIKDEAAANQLQNQPPISTLQELLQAVKDAISSKPSPTFPPLEQETRSRVNTPCAAFHLNRKEQTLRSWACLENGPIRPTRINGRLAW